LENDLIISKNNFDDFSQRFNKDYEKLPVDEVIFWLYTTIREEMLPLGYYNNMIEAAMVMGDTFNFLF